MTTTDKQNANLSYRDAGVDIDAGNALVDRIKPYAKATARKECVGGIGGFGGLFKLPENYKNPVLVSGTDGVGTKLRLAIEANKHDGIGIDLVAMCVNDLLVIGAEPLFFLDYLATGALNVDQAEEVIKSIAEGCRQSGAALIGGETAEMPGMYQSGDYDLAGFCVGVVEQDQTIDGSQIESGHTVIGLASTGPHSNGYSLVRKVISLQAERESMSETELLQQNCGDSNLQNALLAPTKIYVKSVLEVIKELDILGMAHITGGGLSENIPRVLPQNTGVKINLDSWQLPEAFAWLREKGNIIDSEMLRTFNCGVGMAVIVKKEDAGKAIELFNKAGETAFVIGEVVQDANNAVSYHGSL